MMKCIRRYGIVGMVLWACSPKRDKFRHLTVTIKVVGFSRVSRVRVWIRVSIMTTVSLVLVIGWG